MKNKKLITKENNVRIQDYELLEKLNKLYDKTKNENISKNAFLISILRIGADVYERQSRDYWTIKNQTQSLLDAIHEHTKRMNFFIKFSKPFIKNTYANNEVNQTLLLRLYNYYLSKMENAERYNFKRDIQKYDFLPEDLKISKEKLKKYYDFKVD